MKLEKLLESLNDREIKGVALHAGNVRKGYIFFAIVGTARDGHDFIKEAIERGAKIIVHSKEVEKIDGVTYVKVENVVDAMNKIVGAYFKNPAKDMYVIGITGTNGKTTIAQIIYQLSKEFETSGYLGTLGAEFEDVKIKTKLTTLDAISLNEVLVDMKDKGVKTLAMEVSSHGLSFKRVDSLHFDLAIFTNLTQDHLDYYKTMENYMMSKVRLFENRIGLINIDDEACKNFERVCLKVHTYGKAENATYKIKDIKLKSSGSDFVLVYNGEEYQIHTKLRAEYNIYNLVAAIGALHIKGNDLKEILSKVKNVVSIEGRMDLVENDRNLNIFVDYAHTPDGFEKVLSYAKSITASENKLIAVFGSAGQRDAEKRPIMGEIADRYCDLIVLTEEDSRKEDISKIMKELADGIKDTETIFEADRYKAIEKALLRAQSQDTILVLGKGSEKSIEINNEDILWMGDENAIKDILSSNMKV